MNRRRRAVMAAALWALAACGGGAAAPDGGNWVVMGSSSAAGVGASEGQGWVAQLQRAEAARHVQIQNIARSGALTSQALPSGTAPGSARPAPDPAINTDQALTFTPRLVLLAFPTNDVVAGLPATETAANLRTMRAALQARGAKVMVLGTQPRDALDGTQRASQTSLDEQLAADFGTCFVPLFAALADTGGNLQPALSAGDGVHLDDAGHTVVQQRVSAALDACLRS